MNHLLSNVCSPRVFKTTRSSNFQLSPLSSHRFVFRSQCRAISTPSENGTLKTLLKPIQQQLLNREVVLLNTLSTTIEQIGASQEDISNIRASAQQLEDLFLLVVVGEFNSGKSSFLNALLGNKHLQDGVTPTTSKIDTLRYGTKYSVEEKSKDVRIIRLPVDWLREISLVDTPGTNAVFRIHQQLTEHFLPRADLVLWVTSVDRAFSESEHQFLEQVKIFKKKIVVILSKIDFIDETEIKEIEKFVRKQFNTLLQDDPPIFPVSAKKALTAKLSVVDKSTELATNQLWIDSKFGPLQSYILESLSSEERAWLKLKNPLGVSEPILAKYLEETHKRQEVLVEDKNILTRIELELSEYEKDMARDFSYHKDRVDNVLLRLSERAREYINNTITISNLNNLLFPDTIKREFEEKVVGQSSQEIEKHVNDLVDWILKKNSKQWSNIVEYLQSRAALKSRDIIGKTSIQFINDRSKMLEALGNSASKVFASFDRKYQATRLTDSIKAAIYQTAITELGAAGLATLLSTSLFDVSGIIPAGVIAVSGLAILPYHRSRINSSLQHQIEELRSKMNVTLSLHFKEQTEDGVMKMKDNISPYSHFVSKENDHIQTIAKELKKFDEQVKALVFEIDKAFDKLPK